MFTSQASRCRLLALQSSVATDVMENLGELWVVGAEIWQLKFCGDIDVLHQEHLATRLEKHEAKADNKKTKYWWTMRSGEDRKVVLQTAILTPLFGWINASNTFCQYFSSLSVCLSVCLRADQLLSQ